MSCNRDHLSLTSPYCPECGEALLTGPLAELLNHCTKTLARNEKRLLKLQRYGWKEEETASQRALIVKWRSWTDALRDVVET